MSLNASKSPFAVSIAPTTGGDALHTHPKSSVGVADLEQLTSLLKLLSDPTRLNILMLLAQGERNVTSLCDELQLPQPTVSHHLGLLRMSNVINNRRAGKQVFYTLGTKVENITPGELQVAGEAFSVKITPRG
jgi:DNA-binding transcriptional ArsR family regulator